jgi:hypothetical protein
MHFADDLNDFKRSSAGRRDRRNDEGEVAATHFGVGARVSQELGARAECVFEANTGSVSVGVRTACVKLSTLPAWHSNKKTCPLGKN